MRTYTTPEVCRLTGATYREVDYWCRRGLIVPAVEARGSGSARAFSDANVAEVRLVVALRGLGCPLARIAEFLDVLGDDPERVLVADADGGIEACSPADVFAAVARSGGAAVVVAP